MNKVNLMIAASAALLGTRALPAMAATVYSDRTAFEAAAGTFEIEDFTGFGGSGCSAFQNIPAIDCGAGPSVLDFGSFTVEAYAQPYIAPGANLLDPDLHLYVSGGEALQIGGHPAPTSNFQAISTWTFDESLYAFATDTDNSTGTMTITLFDNGSEILSFDVTNPVDTDPYFFGVISNLPFDQLVIHQERGNTDFYDNITFQTVSSVPLPAAVWLFGSGLLGLTGVARRKAAAQP